MNLRPSGYEPDELPLLHPALVNRTIVSHLDTRKQELYFNQILYLCGADDGTRTRNLLITNQLLCQLSYVGTSKPETLRFKQD